jgi:hypothetical protein
MASFFQVQSQRGGETRYAMNLTTSVATIRPGLMVRMDAAGRTVSLQGATGSRPLGMAYGSRFMTYAPTSKTFASGEQLAVIGGHFFATLSADFFTSGSLPTEDVPGPMTPLYAGANGTLAVTGTIRVGRLIDTVSYTLPQDGTGLSQNAALCEFNFDAAGA